MKRHRATLVLAMLLSLFAAGTLALAQEPPPPPSNQTPDVDITVHHDDDSGFAVSPVWLAVGGAALLGLIAFIVAVARRSDSGTTIVREQR